MDSTPATGQRCGARTRWPAWLLLILVLSAVSVAFVLDQVRRARSAAPHHGRVDPRLPVPDFALTAASGQSITRSDLLGRTWIADFIFTHCAGPCPLMTQKMAALQRELSDVSELRLVSFSVDPERDTPQVLSAYAQRCGANPQRWLMLTGELEHIYDLAIDGFKIAVQEARQNRDIIHDTRFILVDRAGLIRGYFDSNDAAELNDLRTRARELAAQD